MEDKSKQVFEEIFKQSENNYCFECGAPSNHWASVSNGIFLCLNCSGLHRGFGVNISFVRSVTMDTWSDLQLSMMKNGGNGKLRSFFESYNIPKDGPIDFKYKTRAGQYYREMAEGKEIPTAPSLEEGLELLQFKTNNLQGQTVGFGSSSNTKEEYMILCTLTVRPGVTDKILGVVGKAATDTFNATKNVINKTSEKMKDSGISDGISNFGQAVVSGTKQVASKVTETVTDPNLGTKVKEVGSKVATGVKDTASSIGKKTSELWQERDQIAAKTADMAKKGFNGLTGFFKKITGSGNTDSNVLVEETKDATQEKEQQLQLDSL